MTLINDHRPAPQPEYTRPVPRYTLALLGPDGLVRFYVELKAGVPEGPSPARLAILENGKIIASVNLEAQ